MRKQLRRGDRVRRKNAVGIAILVIFAISFAVVGWLRFRTSSVTRDANNCRPEGPESITVVAVDATDVLDAIQRLALTNELTTVVDSIPLDAGVQVWRVAPSETAVPDAAGPLLCNPGEKANRWLENENLVKRRYLERFRQPLLSQLDQFVQAKSSPQSPIMESIQAIAIRTFDQPQYRNITDKRLVIASDLIQNTATYSQLHSIEAFDRFAQSVAFHRLAPRLNGVRVSLLYIQRPTSPNFKQQIEFWQQFFFKAGASLDGVRPVAGMNQQQKTTT